MFNLGGDLELFCRLIREGDRARLLDYAQRCVRGVHAFHAGLGTVPSIALVQGNALGRLRGRTELPHHRRRGRRVDGLPEVLFDLFPGMGAYSFLCQRISPRLAEKIMLEGNLYTASQLKEMGLVDIVVPVGEGVAAVEQVIKESRRIPHAWAAMRESTRSPPWCRCMK